MTVDTWSTESVNPVTAARDQWSGRESLMKRAAKRTVRQLNADAWLVDGSTALGDTYDTYQVVMGAVSGGRGTVGRYRCACYTHGGGEVRARKVCSHVLAVILYRRKRKAVELARGRIASRRKDGEAGAQDEPGDGAGDGPTPAGAVTLSVVPSTRDEMFGEPPLPEWLREFRPEQWNAIQQVVEAFEGGAKVVFLQAPCGSGKSAVAETVRRLLRTRGVYVATTRALQDQVAKDFDNARVLKGRSNYDTIGGATVNLWGEHQNVDAKGKLIEVTCADCTRTQDSACRWCAPMDSCPYRIAKQLAVGGDLAVLNTSYWLTDANKGAGVFGVKNPRGLVVIDEADTLESELMGQVEVHISKGRATRLGIAPPSRKTVPAAWEEWVEGEGIPKVTARLAELGPLGNPKQGAKEIREHKALTNLLDGLKVLKDELPLGGWVYDGYERGDITFKPVSVRRYGQEWIWRHGKRFLLMSATIISAQQMAEDLGLDGDYAVVDVPMSFLKENRPIRICAVAEMTRKNEVEAIPKIANATANIVMQRPGKRVLVHTVSYKLSDAVYARVREVNPDRAVYRYLDSAGKDKALERYLATEGAVLIAPSMDRGVDLPNEACEVQVVCRLPRPNMGDKQVNARMHTAGGNGWYAMLTARSLVQSCGRGVRHDQDVCETLILDHTFTTQFWPRSQRLLPKWWVDALDWHFDVRTIL